MASITLGNFFTTNDGKNVLGGVGGSGLDTKSLIDGLLAARRAPAVQAQDKIDLNNKQASALATFQNLLTIFRSSVDALRNPPGVGNEGDNAFKFTTASVTANNGSTGSDYLTVTTTPGTVNQTYTVDEITSIASKAQQIAGTYTVADADTTIASASPIGGTANQFGVGTITFNTASIDIAEGDTLNQIAAKFNAVKDTTGVNATVIQVASGSFKLFFSANDTGTNGNFDLSGATDPSGVLTGAGIGAATAGTNANFKLNGIAITRQSNTVDDVIDGLTFNLLQPFDVAMDANVALTVAVTPDTTTVQNSIVNFVQAYNALKSFEAEQTQLNGDGTFADTAVLANNQTFRNAMADLKQRITAQVSGIASGPSSLSDIGITFTTQPATDTLPAVDNVLTINDGALAAALASNFSGVNKLFGFTLTSNNPNLAVYSATNDLAVSSFSLNIDPGTSTFQATYNLGSGPVTVDMTATSLGAAGYSLTGQAGTALEGLVLIYGSTSSASIDVTATQGIAATTYNTSATALEPNTGTLAVDLSSIADSTNRLNDEITRINDQVSQYQQELLNKFALLEQAISNTNNLLSSLQAQQNAALAARN